MREYNQLKAFQLADELVFLIYPIIRKFPVEERFELSSQMRRAVVSVPTNIVEGCARSTQVEYHRFLDISFGSLRELDYLFSVALRLGFIKETNEFIEKCDKKLKETIKVLGGLLKSME